MPPAPADADAPLVDRPSEGRVFEGTRRVRLGDVDPSGRLRFDAAARYLQDVSADDTADAALPDAEAWVVRRTVVVVGRFPRYHEPLVLATWCGGTGSRWAERRVRMIGERGGRIDAASTWVHMDPASGRPRRLSSAFLDRYGAAAGDRRVSARLTHPDPPDDGGSPSTVPWALRVTDLDVLGHVNNAAYWEVVEEHLGTWLDGRRGAVRAEVEHRTAIEPPASVEVVVVPTPEALSLWVVADGDVAATALVSHAL